MRLDPDKEYLICDYCGTLHFPDANADGVRVLGEASSDHCPICAIPLVEATLASHRILYCERCRGMLILMGRFLAIIQDLRSRREPGVEPPTAPDWNGLQRHINCPHCGGPMDTHAYGGAGNIIIDDCEFCQVNWLDYGEMDRIVRAPDPRHDSSAWDAA
jgi:Zn-finger nucleic acid-binding protein